jgi:hypothetical protein
MIWIWIGLCVWMAAFVIVEFTVNTEKADPIDLEETFKDGWN